MSTMIYLDNHATTPIDRRVLEAMMPFLTDDFANPNSRHPSGARAAGGIEVARGQVARLLGASPADVVFTSGATESNYAAILGACRGKRGHVITSSIEHKSVLGAMKVLEEEGFEVSYLSPGADGLITAKQIEAALRPDTIFVSLMLVNNEIGTINPVAEIGASLSRRGILFHTDAAQALGKIPLDVSALNVDLLSASAHKLYGPKGVGALFIRASVRSTLVPMMRGGGQEGGMRGGTQNVPGIVGFGRASELAFEALAAESSRLFGLRARLLEGLRAVVPDLVVHGTMDARVAGNLSVSFPDVPGQALMKVVSERVALSSGAACAAGANEISHVLRAMHVADDLARATLRIGLGRFSTEADVDEAVWVIGAAATSLRVRRSPKIELPPPAERFSMAAIGYVANAVDEPAYIQWGTVRSRVQVDPAFAAALRDLDSYSHVIIVYWMHRVSTQKLEHVPQGNATVPDVGMFACRCPYRPNPIAVSTVRLIAVEEAAIVVEGLDAIDGTPVLDVKPYTPPMDAPRGEVRTPAWIERLTY